MKILFLTPDLFGTHGGIARYCRLALKAMTESTLVDAVDVISLHDPQGRQPDTRYFAQQGRSYEGCSGDRVHFLYRVALALLRKSYDMVIAGHVNLSPLVFLSRPSPRPYAKVIFVYGIDAWIRLPWLRRVSLQRADCVVAVSRYTAEAAVHFNQVDDAKVNVVYGCLDPLLSNALPDSSSNNTHRDLTLGKNSFITVSRLSRLEASKGHFTILQAFGRVLDAVPDATYCVIGDGDLRPVLEQLASELDIAKHVRFLGALSDEDLRVCYRQCTAYVMPSKWEGFGLAFLEAMTNARPIIAGRCDATPEVVGDAALLVDPDDPQELAEAIVAVLSSAELQTRLGEAGRKRLAEHFTYETFRTALLGQLEQLVDPHGSRSNGTLRVEV